MTEKNKFKAKMIPLSIFAQVSKSGDRYYLRISPQDIRLKKLRHKKWYEALLRELSEQEVKELGLEK